MHGKQKEQLLAGFVTMAAALIAGESAYNEAEFTAEETAEIARIQESAAEAVVSLLEGAEKRVERARRKATDRLYEERQTKQEREERAKELAKSLAP